MILVVEIKVYGPTCNIPNFFCLFQQSINKREIKSDQIVDRLEKSIEYTCNHFLATFVPPQEFVSPLAALRLAIVDPVFTSLK